MKKILLLIIISSYQSRGQVYFEGILTFETNITTSEFAPENLQETLEYNYGDTLKIFYNQKGGLIRKYLNTGEFGNNYQIYPEDNGILLIINKGTNKIDSLDVTKNSLKLLNKTIIKNKEIINNLKCDCIIYNALDERKENVILEYCFSKSITHLNPKNFQNHKDFFLSDFFDISNSPYLRFKMKTKEFELTFTAKEIEEKILTVNDISNKKTLHNNGYAPGGSGFSADSSQIRQMLFFITTIDYKTPPGA